LFSKTRRNEDEAFALARRQSLASLFQFVNFTRFRPHFVRTVDSVAGSLQQSVSFDRLFEEIYRPGLHGAYSGRDVAVPGNKNDREERFRSTSWSCKPLIPGINKSQTMQDTRSGAGPCRNSTADANASTLYPAASIDRASDLRIASSSSITATTASGELDGRLRPETSKLSQPPVNRCSPSIVTISHFHFG
jgi:hypothetical protein